MKTVPEYEAKIKRLEEPLAGQPLASAHAAKLRGLISEERDKLAARKATLRKGLKSLYALSNLTPENAEAVQKMKDKAEAELVGAAWI